MMSRDLGGLLKQGVGGHQASGKESDILLGGSSTIDTLVETHRL